MAAWQLISLCLAVTLICVLFVLWFLMLRVLDTQEVPAANSFSSPRKSGVLKKLTRRGWLYRGSWKERYCVLDGTKLYFFDNENSKGTERSSGVLNLDYFDVCEESKPKDKRAFNVFSISTSVRGIFDLQTRHFFSAETLPQMTEWIHLIRGAIAHARNNRSRAGRSGGKERSSEGREASLKSQRSTRQDSSPNEENSPSSDGAEEVNVQLQRERINCDGRLYTPTKNRAKGPTGRRLPQRRSLAAKMEDSGDEIQGEPVRSRSTSALECITENEIGTTSWGMNGLSDYSEGGRSASQNALAYKYSSSEESLPPTGEGKVKRLTRILQIPTSAPPAPHQPMLINRSNLNRQTEITTTNDYAGSLAWQRPLRMLETKVSGLEQEMVVTRSDLATVHTSVGRAQGDVDRALQRIDRMATQVVQVERQLADISMEARKVFQEAEVASRRAAEARTDYLRLKEDCQQILSQLGGTQRVSPVGQNSLAK